MSRMSRTKRPPRNDEELIRDELRILARRVRVDLRVDFDDLAQCARIELWRKAPPEAMALRRLVARSAIYTELRRQTHFSKHTKRRTMVHECIGTSTFDRLTVDPPTPEPWLWDLVDRSTTPHRARLLRDRFIGGRGHKEIGRDLGIGASAVRDAISRGLKDVRRGLVTEGL